MITILVIFLTLLAIISIVLIFAVYKANQFKNKIEGAVTDGIKEVIVENTPKVAEAIKNKINDTLKNKTKDEEAHRVSKYRAI